MPLLAATDTITEPKPPLPPDANLLNPGLDRILPCDLKPDEFMKIAKQRVEKEKLRDQIKAVADRNAKKVKEQLDEYDDEINNMRRELHANAQDRTVACNEYFLRTEDGNSWVILIRLDTHEEVSRRPATPIEKQTSLKIQAPKLGPKGPLLDQAREAQADAGESGVPDALEDDADDDGPEDDGLTELTQAQKSAAEAKAARASRRKAGGNGRAKGGGK